MAGEVRQAIDQASLERYIESNVPDIKVPIKVKQVSARGVQLAAVIVSITAH